MPYLQSIHFAKRELPTIPTPSILDKRAFAAPFDYGYSEHNVVYSTIHRGKIGRGSLSKSAIDVTFYRDLDTSPHWHFELHRRWPPF
jgi:hypothetical protein